MVVDEHVFVCLQIEVRVVLRVLTEADCPVLVYDAANLHDMSCAQLAVILVANNLYLFAYTHELSVKIKVYLRSIVVIMRQPSSMRSILPTKAIVRPTNCSMCGTPTNGWGSRCTFFTSSVMGGSLGFDKKENKNYSRLQMQLAF